MPSFAYNTGTTAGTLYDQGMKNLVDLGNKYSGNESIGGLVAGTLADTFRTQAQTGLALQYNNAFLGSLANYQSGLENLRTGNTMKLMSAEGQIAKDLVGAQGAQQRLGIQETGAQQRLGITAQGTQDRLNIGAQGQEDRLTVQTKGSEDRKNIQTAGAEERLNIAKRATEEKGLRADARGAIRSLGARFYG
jgi:hypothetical protein